MKGVHSERTWQLQALTDLWTGDSKGEANRLIPTGLLGSLRWWFEVLVRGLEGYACDPSNTKCKDRNHCVACELFGCTGWARKFRFQVLDGKGDAKTDQIKQNQTVSLRFTPLRPIRPEEWALLSATLRLIAEYGAMGGKTVYKPSDESGRQNQKHHQDYGLVKVTEYPLEEKASVAELKRYVTSADGNKPGHGDFAWASLQQFWFVDKMTLSRENAKASSFNKVLGRKESKICRDCGKIHDPPEKCPNTNRHPERYSEHLVNRDDEIAKWLAGSQQESKKVFSFKNPARTFGFVKSCKTDADVKNEFKQMKKKLESAWGQNSWDFLTGDKVIDQLFAGKEDRP